MLKFLPIMLFQYAQNSTDYDLILLCPKIAYYTQTMPINSGSSKLVCSNNCITLLCTASQCHHQSQTRPRHLLGDLPADYMDHTLAIM